jgi:hypothetical protein
MMNGFSVPVVLEGFESARSPPRSQDYFQSAVSAAFLIATATPGKIVGVMAAAVVQGCCPAWVRGLGQTTYGALFPLQ